MDGSLKRSSASLRSRIRCAYDKAVRRATTRASRLHTLLYRGSVSGRRQVHQTCYSRLCFDSAPPARVQSDLHAALIPKWAERGISCDIEAKEFSSNGKLLGQWFGGYRNHVTHLD
jgi:hypothetical protein